MRTHLSALKEPGTAFNDGDVSMNLMQHVAEDAGTIGNGTASAAVVGVSFAGIGLPDWVAIISGVYFLISTVFLVMKVAAWRKDRNAKTKTTSDGAD